MAMAALDVPSGEAGPSWRRVAIVGAGYMGRGIGQILALAGLECVLADRSTELAEEALRRTRAEVQLYESQAWLPAGSSERIEALTHASPSVGDACRDADLVIEAVFEDRDVKAAALASIEAATADDTVIGTNTSSIPIASLAAGLRHPRRFLGIHFFNPPQFVPGVEVIAGHETSTDCLDQVEVVLRRAGKHPARVEDSPGFVANRLQYALFQEAAAIVEEGAATPQAVDEIVRSTFGFRLPFFGPFAIADMAGLDVYRGTYAVLEAAYPGRFTAPRILLDLIERGAHGAKSGEGFVVTDRAQAEAMIARRDGRYVALGRLIEDEGEDPSGDVA